MLYPKISVIIVTFNSENELEGAIESYIHQNYANKELIIIDGNSKDNTIDIIKRYENYISYWCSEPENGIYDAMNKGWKRAKGDYILYLGCDDRLLEGALSALGNNANDADLVFGDVKCLHFGGKVRERITTSNFDVIRKHAIFSHQSLIMKREVFEEFNGFNCKYRILADYDLILRAYLGGAKMQYVHHFISLFNMGGISGFTFKSDKEKLAIHLATGSIKHPYALYYYNLCKKCLQIIKNRWLQI